MNDDVLVISRIVATFSGSSDRNEMRNPRRIGSAYLYMAKMKASTPEKITMRVFW